MISVEEACRLVTEWCKVPYVKHITELDNIYLIPTLTKDGESPCTGTSTVNRITGELGVFRFSRENCMNLKNNGKDVEIPEKYKYPGEIKY